MKLNLEDQRFTPPADFKEFYERYPNYVRDFLRRKFHWSREKSMESGEFDERIADLEQELLLHLMALPLDSKYREMGYTDRIQTYNREHFGEQQHQRTTFWGFLKTVLGNKLYTLQAEENVDALSKGELEPVSPEASTADLRTDTERLLFVRECSELIGQNCPDLLPVFHSFFDESVKDALVKMNFNEYWYNRSVLIRFIRSACASKPGQVCAPKRKPRKNRIRVPKVEVIWEVLGYEYEAGLVV